MLDVLAEQRGPHGRPLLERSPEVLPGRRDLARRGLDARRAALAGFAREARLGSSQREALQTLDEALVDPDPRARTRTYGALSGRLADALAAIDDPENRARALDFAVDYTRACVGFERHLVEVLDTRWIMRRAQAVMSRDPTTARAVLDRRAAIMAEPDPDARREQLNAWATEVSDQLWNAEGGRRSPADARLDEARDTQRATLLAALSTQAGVLDLAPSFDAAAFLEAHEQAERRELAARDARSLGAAGRHRFTLGAQALVDPDLGLGEAGAWSPRLTFGYGYILQRLGEARRRGYRPDIEIEALSLRLTLPTDEGAAEIPQAELVVFRYLTLEQRLGPLRQSWSDAFGWTFGLRAERDLTRGVDLGGRVDLGYTLPVAGSDDGVNYLVLAGTADLAGRAGDAGGVFLGPRLLSMAQLHLGGAYANVLRATAQAVPYVGLDDAELRVESELRLDLALALLGTASSPLVATPYAAVRTDWTLYDPDLGGSLDGRGGPEAVDDRWTLGVAFELP